MALIHCPECGKEISEHAAMCPHCGLPHELFNTLNSQPDTAEAPKAEARTEEPEYEGFVKRETNSDASQAEENDKPEEVSSSFYKRLQRYIIAFENDYNYLFHTKANIEPEDLEHFKGIYTKMYGVVSLAENYDRICKDAEEYRIDMKLLKSFIERMGNIDEMAKQRNIESNTAYLDTVLRDVDPVAHLNEEQRQSIISDKEFSMLMGTNRAGKSAATIAKVRYLVERQKVAPEDILVLPFTYEAETELLDAINKQMKIPVKVTTFHTFVFNFIKSQNLRIPAFQSTPYDIVEKILVEDIFADPKLMKDVLMFLGLNFEMDDDLLNFRNLNEYNQFIANQTYESLKGGEFLRSLREVQIANYLYLNGIEYEYARPYPYAAPMTKKKYVPDFNIKQGTREAWVEIYALSQRGFNARFGEKSRAKYAKSIADKRNLHEQNRTTLLEIWAAYNDKRPVLDHFAEDVEYAGFLPHPTDHAEIYRKILETSKDRYITKFALFLNTFIQQFKTAGYDSDGFDILRSKTDDIRTLKFLNIAESVYVKYQMELHKLNKVDFNDMIHSADGYMKAIANSTDRLPFKYIIVDERRDIPKQLFDPAKRLSQMTDAKIVAVDSSNMKDSTIGLDYGNTVLPDDPIMRLVADEKTHIFVKDKEIPQEEMNKLVSERCPVCGFPLKKEFNKNYGMTLWSCTNEPEICDFMTNDIEHKYDVFICPECRKKGIEGLMIVTSSPATHNLFYECTNYNDKKIQCTYSVPIKDKNGK